MYHGLPINTKNNTKKRKWFLLFSLWFLVLITTILKNLTFVIYMYMPSKAVIIYECIHFAAHDQSK